MQISKQSRILLISTSRLHGGRYFDYIEDDIKLFLKGITNVLFFPFALFDHDAYADMVKPQFAAMGFSMDSIHTANDPIAAITQTDGIFIGGGNTFRLLKTLQDLELIEPIRRKIESGAPYIGSSAGSNVAGPTIKTTNDMPIVQPRTFDALGLVPFQINPHYLDPDPSSTHMGETREERIMQFLEENETPVAGIREGAWIAVANGTATLKGARGARIFRRGHLPVEASPGDDISSLLGLTDTN